MLIYIKNTSGEKSLFVTAVLKDKPGVEIMFGDEKPTRSVLRPGEAGEYKITEDYIVGMEIL